jgi:hypothetical protein
MKETYKRKEAFEGGFGEKVPTCPKYDALVDDYAMFCNKCGNVLRPQDPIASPSPSSSPTKDKTRTYAIIGFISAILSLFTVVEIFGPAAIILGAYTWKNRQGKLGPIVLILGIICMYVGFYEAYI